MSMVKIRTEMRPRARPIFRGRSSGSWPIFLEANLAARSPSTRGTPTAMSKMIEPSWMGPGSKGCGEWQDGPVLFAHGSG